MRFPEFEGEWNVKKLGEICKLVRGPFGSALKKDFFVNEGYAVYEQSHAINNNFNSFRYYITKEKFNELKRFSVHPQDLIMSCSGTMGKFAIVPKESKKGVINQALLKLTTKENYNYKFIKSVLELPDTQNKLLSQSAGGAIKNIVGIPQIKEMDLHIPILKEQQKIASFVSLIDHRIETQSQIIEELETLKKGLIRSFIRKKAMNILLKDCLNCHSSTLMESAVIEKKGTYPVYGATGIISYTPDYEIEKDAILIIKDGASVGKVQYAKDKYSVIGTLNYLTPKENVSLKYLYYYLQSFNFEKYKVGSGIPHIYFKDYGNEYIYCPPLEKQNKIANFLSAIDEKLETEKQILKKYTEQKKYLLANMFI